MNSLHSVMNHWTVWAETPTALRIGSTLLHFLWQGAAIAILAWIILAALRQARPQTKYAALLTMFCLASALPVVTFIVLQPDSSVATGESTDAAHESGPRVNLGIIEQSETAPGATDRAIPVTLGVVNSYVNRPSLSVTVASEATVSPVASPPPAGTFLAQWLRTHRPWVVAFWLCGVLVLSVRLTIGLVGAELARRRKIAAVAEPVQQIVHRLAERLQIRRAIRVFESTLAEVPTLVGWLRPVILLPASAITGLTPSQLEAILAHELAHVRRNDAIVNLLQTVVETLLFYHPAVWWLSRRIRQEREHCCDDVAVAVCGDRVAFARALTAMEELRAAPRWALAASGGSLVERVRRIVGRPQVAPGGRLSVLGLVAAAGVMAAIAIYEAPAEDKTSGHSVVRADDVPVDLNESADNSLFDLAANSGPIPFDAVVARVEGRPIRVRDVLAEYGPILRELNSSVVPSERGKHVLEMLRNRLPDYVDQALMVHAVKSRLNGELLEKVEQQLDEEFEKYFEEVRRTMNVDTLDEVDANLASQGLDRSAMRRLFGNTQLARQYLQTSVGNPTPTDDELQKAYRARETEFTEPGQVRWQQIVIVFKKHTNREGAKEVADQALAALEAGQSFDDVAGQFSDGPDPAGGGRWDWTRIDSLAPELQEPLSTLAIVESASGLIETSDAFQIVQPLERREAHLRPLAEVREQLVQELKLDKQKAEAERVLKDLRSQYAVETIFDGEQESPPEAPKKPQETAPVQPVVQPKPAKKAIQSIRVLNTRGEPVAGAKVVPNGYSVSGSTLSVDETWFPAVTTDAEGRATIVCTKPEILDQLTRSQKIAGFFADLFSVEPAPSYWESVFLQVEHPDHPTWWNSVFVDRSGQEGKVILADSSTIEIRAKRADDGKPVTRLVPTFGGHWTTGIDWSEQDGLLTVRKVDLSSEQSPRWMVVVHVPEQGPAMFSEPVDLKQVAAEKVSLTLAMRDAVRVEGRLDRTIDVPIQNARVVGLSVLGVPDKGIWAWSSAAEVRDDGTFVIESVPPDMTLQLVGLCDGWITRSTTREEFKDYAWHDGFWSRYPAVDDRTTSLIPRLYYVQNRTVKLVLPMERTGSCEVAVVDDEQNPIEGASVIFNPNVQWFNWGSNIVGTGSDAMAYHRQRLATGKDPRGEYSPISAGTFMSRTDARGLATVRGLPPCSDSTFTVARDTYVNRDGPQLVLGIGVGLQTVKIEPGKTSRTTVHMLKDANPVRQAAKEDSAVAPVD
jgi:beta-lactamase regulating signal transducer with metallopeptidase domain/parvulin-like peptidyl-prolyl isomerase